MAHPSSDAGEIRASSTLLDRVRGGRAAFIDTGLIRSERQIGRRAKPPVWPQWVTHLVVPLGGVVLGVVGGFLQDRAAVLGPLLLGAVALAALAFVRPPPAAAAGVAGWFGVASFCSVAVMLVAGNRQWSILAGLAVVAGVGVGQLVYWIVGRRAAGMSLDALFDALWTSTFEPPRWLGTWIIGAAAGLPLLALYAPMITDSDSAWIVVSTSRVREQGIHLLQTNQDVFLPHLMIGPLARWGGYPAAGGFAVVSVIALLAFGSALACWLTRRPIAGFVAAFTLLAMPEVAQRADRLPMYATMLICGYGGGWMIHRTMSDRPAPRWWAAVGGVGLVVAYEAHSVGQLFLLVPFLLLILHPFRRAWRGLAVALATMLVVSIPRIVVNLSIGGLDRFRSNYTDWLIQKGYLRAVNQDFWGQQVNGSPVDYFANVPEMAAKAFGGAIVILFLLLAVAAAHRAQRRTTAFCVASVVVYLAALTIASPGTYARYLMPLSLGMALVAGVGAVAMTRSGFWGRRLIVVGVAALVGVSIYNVTVDASTHQDIVRRTLPLRHELTSHIPPGAGVVGVRSHDLVWADPGLRAEFSRTMTEQDFITFLTWPSDRQVLEVLNRLDAQYVALNPHADVEFGYHQTWLTKFFGKRDRHARVRHSPNFCRVAVVGGYELFRVGACTGS